MANGFIKKTRDELIRVTREKEASYIDSSGATRVAPPNSVRMNYTRRGKFIGMKFGDGDTAYIPLTVNEMWRDKSSPGTIVAIGQAPTGVVWLKCGSIELTGNGAMTIHIVSLTQTQVENDLSDEVILFPNGEDVDEDCHFLTFKYYNESGIDFGEEYQIMTEFNTFLHEAWK